MDAHSFTTVSVRPDGSARVGVTLIPDAELVVLVPVGRAQAQISLEHCGALVTIAPTNGTAPHAQDVQTARQLAAAFAAYAAEVARLHTLAHGSGTPDSERAA